MPHQGLVVCRLFFLSFAVENQKDSAENTARSQEPKILSIFYHFLLFTAICIRVVRKTPIAEGSWLNGKSISIIHFQPEFHTLEALDIILGNQEGNSCGAGHTPQDFSLLIQGVSPPSVQRFVGFCEIPTRSRSWETR